MTSVPYGIKLVALTTEVNLSAINCRTFRRTSKQYQNLIFCKQTQNEREGHSREYPHRPIQIWACHTQTMEVHVSRFYYAASQEPELSFFRIALPATVFRYQSQYLSHYIYVLILQISVCLRFIFSLLISLSFSY